MRSGGAGALPRTSLEDDGVKGLDWFLRICDKGRCLRQMGCLLAWLIAHVGLDAGRGEALALLPRVLPLVDAGLTAVHRPLKKRALPFRLGELEQLLSLLGSSSFEVVASEEFFSMHGADSWLLLAVLYTNWLHGSRGAPRGRWLKKQVTAISCLQATVQRFLQSDGNTGQSAAAVEKELSNRYISYTGEEIPKMEALSLEQILPALPPVGHGGSVASTDWTKGKTRSFLLHPSECVVEDVGQTLPKLQARVHIVEGDQMRVATALVERNICDWVEASEVLQYRGERVLNGLFGVAKSGKLDNGKPHLRVIMNLIPSNSVMLQLNGSVQELPSITQYLSVVLAEDESLLMCQSDMSCAFYLFSLPPVWKRFLAFNLCVDGAEIGRMPGRRYYLACGVLPMGWASAVSVMQEVSQHLVEEAGLPGEKQVGRLRALPGWLTMSLEDSRRSSRGWFHVYLDNFFSGERLAKEAEGSEAAELHSAVESGWNRAGVLSSEKKRVVNASQVLELGACFSGDSRSLGASGERVAKLLQTTCLVLSKSRMPKKWLQVVLGRWIHVLQFRRAGMSGLHAVWKVVAGKKVSGQTALAARREVFLLYGWGCTLPLLLRG